MVELGFLDPDVGEEESIIYCRWENCGGVWKFWNILAFYLNGCCVVKYHYKVSKRFARIISLFGSRSQLLILEYQFSGKCPLWTAIQSAVLVKRIHRGGTL